MACIGSEIDKARKAQMQLKERQKAVEQARDMAIVEATTEAAQEEFMRHNVRFPVPLTEYEGLLTRVPPFQEELEEAARSRKRNQQEVLRQIAEKRRQEQIEKELRYKEREQILRDEARRARMIQDVKAEKIAAYKRMGVDERKLKSVKAL